VWLIDPDHWPRALLRAELIERGLDAVGFRSIDEAILRLAVEQQRRPRLVLVNLTGQELTAAAVALLSSGGVPVVGVAGAQDTSGERLGLTEVLRRPLSLGEIADAVERLLGAR
jgi:hypothetical protein